MTQPLKQKRKDHLLVIFQPLCSASRSPSAPQTQQCQPQRGSDVCALSWEIGILVTSLFRVAVLQLKMKTVGRPLQLWLQHCLLAARKLIFQFIMPSAQLSLRRWQGHLLLL